MAPGYRFSDSVVIRASGAALYAMISDVTRMGEWSPQCRWGRWDEGDGPTVGAHFTGHNEKPGRTWETRNEIVVADPDREFAWVTEGAVRWGYTIEESGDPSGFTRLIESWDLSAEGVAELQGQYGQSAPQEIATRVADAHSGVHATLAAMKVTAEAG